MSNIEQFPKARRPTPVEVAEAVSMLTEITERAKALGLGLAKYTVEDVETVLNDWKHRP